MLRQSALRNTPGSAMARPCRLARPRTVIPFWKSPRRVGLNDRVLSLDRLQDSRLTDRDLEGKSLSALSISYNAIYAAHGYVFQRKSLQRIFGPMPWYHPNPAFAESDLTETERANLQTIRAFERKRFGF